MPIFIKQLIVVVALGGVVFAAGKSVALEFMDEGDFKRRRNVWMILTAVAFLSPSFWLFALVAAPILYWAGKKDTNPLALYLLLMNVIPSIPLQIPTNGLGINQLFELDIFRLLSLCVLFPAAIRIHKSKGPERIHGLQRMDLLLIAYGMLTVVLYVPPDVSTHMYEHSSFTNVIRQTVLLVIGSYAVYYVASRSCSSRRAILDAFAAFCLSCTIMALVATFESVRHWLLYADLYARWGGDLRDTTYLFRAGLLRAEAASGNSLALGYLLAIAFGFWLYLQSHVRRFAPKAAVTFVLWVGLLASFSRGPLLGAIVIFIAYAMFRPRGRGGLVKSAFVLLVVLGITLATPIGERITQTLPFMGGKLAEGSLNYRELLLERSWQLIQAHPWLGDQHAFAKMQDLRQGQGIIDLVNTYVSVALLRGFLGLAIFAAFILSALAKAYGAARKTPQPYPDWPLLGTSLVACIIGTLLMLADCSFILGYVPTFFTLAGISVAYSHLTQLPQIDSAIGAPPKPTPELS
jgi:O-antigen ligase